MSTVRRTPEKAQKLILAAAESELRERGPAGLRLQSVASRAGVSHPTVLHHFGSRDGLLQAVVTQGLERLTEDLIEALEAARASRPEPGVLLETMYEKIRSKGDLRLLAWILLSDSDRATVPLERLIDVLGRRAGRRRATFVVLLGALAALGDAVGGRAVFRSAGVDAREARRFRTRLAQLATDELTPDSYS